MKADLAGGDALIIVDVQNDFLPGGSLPVPLGNEVIPGLNRYIAAFLFRQLPIFATRDWHPPDHCSFQQQGGPWPAHCVAQTAGAAFPANLEIPCDTHIISKATSREKDAYSGFFETELNAVLQSTGISRLFIGGLATEYCVLNTVKDALTYRYTTFVLRDAVRGIDVNSSRSALEEMARLGANLIDFEALAA
ncbi:nicotinamidase [Nitrosovibrio sp. Nv6]|uniref:nicotinamidase n=1 Tax=Nitrosovibrio sp. Nv6 TaxID=1855340 RepID=UPI0008C4A635|nr:nicotinamidase [Nitrosovibrio sp. Nv6]SEP19926.1 nicotinamidase/pyrazinamidase [Nitrosovibrio sp. Nv6]